MQDPCFGGLMTKTTKAIVLKHSQLFMVLNNLYQSLVWTVCRFKVGAWQERGGSVFEGGLIPQGTLCWLTQHGS